jgi:hypothetical protein
VVADIHMPPDFDVKLRSARTMSLYDSRLRFDPVHPQNNTTSRYSITILLQALSLAEAPRMALERDGGNQ